MKAEIEQKIERLIEHRREWRREIGFGGMSTEYLKEALRIEEELSKEIEELYKQLLFNK